MLEKIILIKLVIGSNYDVEDEAIKISRAEIYCWDRRPVKMMILKLFLAEIIISCNVKEEPLLFVVH